MPIRNFLTSPSADVLVDALDEVRRAEARLAARKAKIVDALQRENAAHQQRLVWGVQNDRERATFVERSTRAEVARALRIHEQTAASLIAESHALCDALPRTLAALESGVVSAPQAAVIVAEHWTLADDLIDEFETAALAGRTDVPRSTFRRRVRALRERLQPSSIDARVRDAQGERRLSIEHVDDGMSWLTAYLPSPEAVAVYAALGGVALDAHDAGDDRTHDQLRADALVEVVLRGGRGAYPASPDDPARSLRGVTADISVTVPVLTLLGMSDEPAVLDGVGPIPQAVARALAATSSSWQRILTHPITGTVLCYDRQTYRVPTDLARWIRRRDRRCRFPGCTRPAKRSDIDHVIPWARGGCTNGDNLQALCEMHHTLRHRTGWSPVMFPDGRVVWTSPTGHEYETAPDDDWVLPVDPVPAEVLELMRRADEPEAA